MKTNDTKAIQILFAVNLRTMPLNYKEINISFPLQFSYQPNEKTEKIKTFKHFPIKQEILKKKKKKRKS